MHRETSAVWPSGGGKLYGTTFEGGATSGVGTVFDLTLKGKEKVLHTFGVQPGDGVYPFAGVTFDKAGNLYGTTEEGGPYNSSCVGGCGTVYELTATGEEKVLYSFQGQSQDAVFPIANLAFDKAQSLRDSWGRG
ncbi:MAG: choice-of-anchor tandem repeat GloVer-containing protein [Terriglobales bacterium]